MGTTRKFWPIYDFTDDDVWTAIAKNHWEYNKVYDFMYRWGVPKHQMRVSALIHETAWHQMEMLHEFEPKTYDRFTKRIAGASTFDHIFDEGGLVPKQLPFMFRDWRDYRDYLLYTICPQEDRSIYINRWEGQEDERWWKVHVRELILNDTE